MSITADVSEWSKEPDLRSGMRKHAWVQTPPSAISFLSTIQQYQEKDGWLKISPNDVANGAILKEKGKRFANLFGLPEKS
ncbi:hypothetical protein G9A89_001883 [Geosiphon pyriformis]|nr:hypothetical protein G9A89_001883 [Geosiphon pyriformis]